MVTIVFRFRWAKRKFELIFIFSPFSSPPAPTRSTGLSPDDGNIAERDANSTLSRVCAARSGKPAKAAQK